MEMTTIAVTKNSRKKVTQRQIHDLFMDEEGTISIDEALVKANKRWSKFSN